MPEGLYNFPLCWYGILRILILAKEEQDLLPNLHARFNNISLSIINEIANNAYYDIGVLRIVHGQK